ncbi:MAG TPA: thioredoxin TrxC [Desulfobacteraceae bacterium]|nr:thioredoxin TrxC [Desulfobacteraceae bacterium]
MNQTIIRCPACGAKNRIPPEKLHLRARCGRCGSSLAGGVDGKVIELDDTRFDGFVRTAALPVVVDFYSPTCGPCRMLAPVIDDVARKFADRVLFGKIDTSRHQLTASQFNIRGVPTLLFFKQGRLVDQIVGAAPRDQIEQGIRSLL